MLIFILLLERDLKVGAHRCWTESKLLILTEAMHCNKTELLMMAWKYSNVLHLIGSAVLRIIILLPCPVKSFSLMIICDWWLLNRLFGVGDKCHSVLLWRSGGIKAGRAFGGCTWQHLAACKLQQVVTSSLHCRAEQCSQFSLWSLSVGLAACLSDLLNTAVHVSIVFEVYQNKRHLEFLCPFPFYYLSFNLRSSNSVCIAVGLEMCVVI